jgi:hypothetical protein
VRFYNHLALHHGIGGACWAGGFFGTEGDKDKAFAQGCGKDSLGLALGQDPQRQLNLLTQLGETEVRVVRKGENIEVMVGAAVHRLVIGGAISRRMGMPTEQVASLPPHPLTWKGLDSQEKFPLKKSCRVIGVTR